MAEKMKMQSPDLIDKNIAIMKELFPFCVTERRDDQGNLREGIDFELLKQCLCRELVESEERFGLSWVGKKQAILEANSPIQKTLRPRPEKSVDWEHTENLYIEGDNLDALKLLQESYLEKVKLIYIDPPYNTGNDFIYRDSFKESLEEYRAQTGNEEESAAALGVNSETDGRFHSKWCSMMFSRLLLARNFLSRDGVIFISIDDNEVEHLKMICNEVFGRQNFEGHIHWRRRHNQPNDKTKLIGIVTEHILVYAKDSTYLKKIGVGKLDLTADFTNPDHDPKGPWASKPWKTGSGQSGSKYKIVTPTGRELEEEWMGEEATYRKYLAEGRIYFPRGGDGMPRKKYYQFERREEGQCATNWWPHEQFGHNQGANDCMTELFGVKNMFSNPKPVELIRAMIKLANVGDGEIVMDFFSGSASTAHAVMQLNSETGGKRKFILIQLPEECGRRTEAWKQGYGTICQIGQERIRRAAERLRREGDRDTDVGFRVFTVDSSNRKDVRLPAKAYRQSMLPLLESNLKEDRSNLDLLFGCVLEWGLPLSLPHCTRDIQGCPVHFYQDSQLAACFEADVPEAVLKEIAGLKPERAVFRDSSFPDIQARIRADELFRCLAPNTRVKVI